MTRSSLELQLNRPLALDARIGVYRLSTWAEFIMKAPKIIGFAVWSSEAGIDSQLNILKHKRPDPGGVLIYDCLFQVDARDAGDSGSNSITSLYRMNACRM
jgi:hypothetical protein